MSQIYVTTNIVVFTCDTRQQEHLNFYVKFVFMQSTHVNNEMKMCDIVRKARVHGGHKNVDNIIGKKLVGKNVKFIEY